MSENPGATYDLTAPMQASIPSKKILLVDDPLLLTGGLLTCQSTFGEGRRFDGLERSH